MAARNTQGPRVFIVLWYTEGWAPLGCHSNKEIVGTEPPWGFDLLTSTRCVSVDRAEGKFSVTPPDMWLLPSQGIQHPVKQYEERPGEEGRNRQSEFEPHKTCWKDASNAPSASRPYSVAKESVMLKYGRLTRVYLTFCWHILSVSSEVSSGRVLPFSRVSMCLCASLEWVL
jgi:hypothetical protein